MRPIVIFDGVCNFCNASVNFIIRNDPREEFLFAPNQSPAGREILERLGLPIGEVGTVYLVEGDRASARTTAALRIARRLRFPWNLAFALILIPRPLRDAAYDWFARRRYRWFGKAERCRVPTERERARFLSGERSDPGSCE
jgi:predicted DCC family thiol-disulfide oxidoreductase YuxK